MKYRSIFLPLLLALSGCQTQDELPEVRPLPEEKVQINLDVTVNKPEKKQMPQAGKARPVADRTAPRQVAPAPGSGNIVNPLAQKKIDLPPPVRHAAIDSDLNSVERSYVQQIRSRHQKTAEANEEMIFGSFKPQKLIKGK